MVDGWFFDVSGKQWLFYFTNKLTYLHMCWCSKCSFGCTYIWRGRPERVVLQVICHQIFHICPNIYIVHAIDIANNCR